MTSLAKYDQCTKTIQMNACSTQIVSADYNSIVVSHECTHHVLCHLELPSCASDQHAMANILERM